MLELRRIVAAFFMYNLRIVEEEIRSKDTFSYLIAHVRQTSLIERPTVTFCVEDETPEGTEKYGPFHSYKEAQEAYNRVVKRNSFKILQANLSVSAFVFSNESSALPGLGVKMYYTGELNQTAHAMIRLNGFDPHRSWIVFLERNGQIERLHCRHDKEDAIRLRELIFNKEWATENARCEREQIYFVNKKPYITRVVLEKLKNLFKPLSARMLSP